MMKLIFAISMCIVFGACAQNNKKVQSNNIVKSDKTKVAIDTSWTTKVMKTDTELKKILTSKQYYILREQGTERPFSSDLYENHEEGVFICAGCKNPLFPSNTKFNSGTGWPSFYQPYAAKSVSVASDNTMGMSRDEVSCQRCGGHLGHVFDDGPKPTGLRYCMDGDALQFVATANIKKKLSVATFAGGCFWCEETVFEGIRGVDEVISGYSGGKEKNPTYESVGGGETGHAEAFEVYYDATMVKYDDLVTVYLASIDPTQYQGQGPDRGAQYRSIAFYRDNNEKAIIENAIKKITPQYKSPIVVEVTPYDFFVQAEEYHQNYVQLHPENPYVQHESIPRRESTWSKVKGLLK
jgi:peptide methionine sulfoxide reductase msrA/msrB